jgi:hypothetical protein
MIATCESCGSDFLTEADPHVIRPTPQGYKLYCYCHIKGFDEVRDKLQSLEAEKAELEKKLEKLENVSLNESRMRQFYVDKVLKLQDKLEKGKD